MLFALIVVGCKPTADFIYSPDEVKAGKAVTFDASASTVAKPGKGNFIIDYAWDFGDGNTTSSNLPTIKHTYATEGKYTVSLTVTDYPKQKTTVTKTITVVKGDFDINSKVTVQSTDGINLAGVKVTLGDVEATTDNSGIATLTAKTDDETDEVVIKANLAGFVPQSLSIAAKDAAQAVLVLQPIANSVDISNVEKPQLVTVPEQAARVGFEENTFVKADGTAATGAARVELTPWDITTTDLNAMLGNGEAQDAQGERATLISAGMMTVDVYDANDNKLQIAEGKKATLQMDLPYAKIAGNDLTVGSEIPLWSFNEEKGLWIEEGKGTVVPSTTSPVKLAVKAEVAHFSTWNWDFKAEELTSIKVSCQQSAKAVPCNLTANVTLENGGNVTRSSSIPAEGTTLVRFPANAQVNWIATGDDGAIGKATTQSADTPVVIELQDPKTKNFVTCKLPDGTATPCFVTLKATTADGEQTRQANVPATGATITTLWDTTSLNWEAATNTRKEGEAYARYKAVATSNITDNVEIALTREVVTDFDKTIYLKCSETAINGDKPDVCRFFVIGLEVFDLPQTATVNDVPFFFDSGHIKTGTEVAVKFPSGILQDNNFVLGGASAEPNDSEQLVSFLPRSTSIYDKYYKYSASKLNEDYLANKAGILFNIYKNIPNDLRMTLTYNLNSSWDPNAGKE